MKRRVALAFGVILALLALVIWRTRGSGESSATGGTTTSAAKAGAETTAAKGPKVDPRTQPKGSIAGTIRDATKAPIAGATVCADVYSDVLPAGVADDPICGVTDAAGTYKLGELLAASYRITAVAKTFRPEVFRDGERDRTTFDLAAGQHRIGVDLVLHPGGVQITGTVSDITGGPVAGAIVRAAAGFWGGEEGPAALTEQDGTFALWVRTGSVRVSAVAEGYARATVTAQAPSNVTLLLTPESSLSGTVVDARTGAPVEGADVEIELATRSWDGSQSDKSDAKGAFRATRLTPGRYAVSARSEHGYGRTEGSLLVGLGQHVDGVVVKLHPAVKITGKVMIAGSPAKVCTEAGVWFRDDDRDGNASSNTEEDGTVIAVGVLPGTYRPEVWCRGHRKKGEYAPIVVADKDLTDLVWEVEPGSTLRGKVVSKRGEPIADARIRGESKGDARAQTDWIGDTTQADGSYELTGLAGGAYEVQIDSERGSSPKDGFRIDVPKGATVDKDFVLDDTGAIRGTVLDQQGAPVVGVHVNALGADQVMSYGMDAGYTTDTTGAFMIPGLRPGDYSVYASRGMWGQALRKPGTTDDAKQTERVTVKPTETAMVKLVVESQRASIKGVVVDADGAPVGDAYVSNARETDAAGGRGGNVGGTRDWGWGQRPPIVTATDGTFTIDNLSAGKYTLRAYKKGGGEAVAEHVATGTTAKLQIKRTGSIEGVAKRDGGPPLELEVSVADRKIGFERSEDFLRTNGAFVVRDLPAGTFQLTVEGDGSTKTIEVTLAEGEAKQGVEVTLERLITLTGRVVDAVTQEPVAGMQVFAGLASNGARFTRYGDEALDYVSDSAGRFTVKRQPAGKLMIQGSPRDWKSSAYSWFRVLRTVTADQAVVDLGDLPVHKQRIKEGEVAGELGVRFVQHPPEVPPEQQRLEISYIDPKGAAASSGLKVGDVITTIDGIDVTGENYTTSWTLIRAAPGTKLAFGLARGATVVITLKAPS